MKNLISFATKIFSKPEEIVGAVAILISIISIIISFQNDYILSYGDAESHLNIAKRVVEGLTPGLAQLGAVWLPLPHVLMLPFVIFDPLYHTGLAGSFVSAICFVITSIFIYKLGFLLTENKTASYIASFVFISNPNILYIQTTPLTEPVLILFFVLSIYFFTKYIILREDKWLILSALFGFMATISRYDGWFLVLFEAAAIVLLYIKNRYMWLRMEGRLVLFTSLALFGIILWFIWNFLLVGDPFYFTNSIYSAKSQQAGWLAKGQLPAYHNLFLSFLYYFLTSIDIAGILISMCAILGLTFFLTKVEITGRYVMALILLTPFIFYVYALYVGQAVIFIPTLTPENFFWRLFNVRYGLMMVPFASLFFAYLFYRSKLVVKYFLIFILIIQTFSFFSGNERILTLEDGVNGLSSGTKTVHAAYWLTNHYDHGLVLIDDYARSLSIIRTNIPMHDIIYVGNKPYYDESMVEPDKYARWIVMQKNDDVWKHLYENQYERGRLYKYFKKVYTSSEILIFERNDVLAERIN